MTWAIINVVTALLVTAIVSFKIGGYREQFNTLETVGMGGIAAGMLMRIGPIVGKNLGNVPSPFDDWSVTLLHLGLACYFVGRLTRLRRHWLANERTKEAARAHFGGLGRD